MKQKLILFSIIIIINCNCAYAIDYFSGTYEQGLTLANTTQKRVLLIFGAKWCGPCIQMEKGVLKQENIVNYAKEKLITMKIDVDTPAGKLLSKKYQLRGLPHYTLIDGEEKIISMLIGKQSKEDFYSFIQLTNAKEKEDFWIDEIKKLSKKYYLDNSIENYSSLIEALINGNQFEEALKYVKEGRYNRNNFGILSILTSFANHAGTSKDSVAMEKIIKEAKEADFDSVTINYLEFQFAKAGKNYLKADQYLTHFLLNTSSSFPNEAYFFATRVQAIIDYGKQEGQAAFALKYLDYFKINHAQLIKKYQKHHWSERAYLYHRALFLSKLGHCTEAKQIAITILPQYPLTTKHIWGEEYKEELEFMIKDCK